MAEYSEGICGDSVVILKDGQPMSISKILAELKEADYLAFAIDRVGDFMGGSESDVFDIIYNEYYGEDEDV